MPQTVTPATRKFVLCNIAIWRHLECPQTVAPATRKFVLLILRYLDTQGVHRQSHPQLTSLYYQYYYIRTPKVSTDSRTRNSQVYIINITMFRHPRCPQTVAPATRKFTLLILQYSDTWGAHRQLHPQLAGLYY